MFHQYNLETCNSVKYNGLKTGKKGERLGVKNGTKKAAKKRDSLHCIIITI